MLVLPQASKALDRRDDLQKLKAKLSFNREILHSADPASKPWLRKTSGAAAPIREIKDEADAGHGRAAGRMDEMYSLHTASPAQVRMIEPFDSYMTNPMTRRKESNLISMTFL